MIDRSWNVRAGLAALLALGLSGGAQAFDRDEALLAQFSQAQSLIKAPAGQASPSPVPPVQGAPAALQPASPYNFASTNISQSVIKGVKFRGSVEFAAITTQIYRLALKSVQESASKQTGDFAVVLDIDDTVLDNTQYQVDVDDQYSPATWETWVQKKAAGALEGAKEFLDGVRRLPGAHVVFITDRLASQEAATLDNMKSLGLWDSGDLLLGKKDKQDTKEARRRCVEEAQDPRCAARKAMPIIALVGDSARDFEEYYGADMMTTGRAKILAEVGKKYWILPNAMYGQWAREYK